ncbi:MAG: alpha/beta hydrolase [Acidobacteria bacterium]|nr:alpha/beta hydrolase [Acidobacteriota bacterium]
MAAGDCDRRGSLAAVLLALALVTGGCASGSAPDPASRLAPCADASGPADALCGHLEVFEDRDARAGRTIKLNIVVLPALGRDAASDPVFFLAGGPGQGAAQMARDVRTIFSRLQTNRDIVLVDQRGTGDSNALDCTQDDDRLEVMNEPEEQALARLKACLDGYDADPRFYTTPIAMNDLDDVRAYLGYERINLYGGSYGTRAALVYMRQHGARVRTAVLDGVAPTNMRLPLFFARDAQRALDRMIADCAADAECNSRFPNLGDRIRQLFARLDAAPVQARLVHPRTGVSGEVRVNAMFLANVVMGALYAPLTASVLPALLARAEQDDFQGLLALATTGGGAVEDNMSVGMQLSVICAEDAPRILPGDHDRESAGTVFGRHLLGAGALLRACEFWPHGTVPADYYEPLVSDIPTLVLSGDVDPVTPPSWGDAVVATLSRGRHIVAPSTGHGVVGTGCGQRVMQAFIESGTAEGLETRCVDALARPPFVVSPTGPRP